MIAELFTMSRVELALKNINLRACETCYTCGKRVSGLETGLDSPLESECDRYNLFWWRWEEGMVAKRLLTAVVSILIVGLSACTSALGPKPILTADGPARTYASEPAHPALPYYFAESYNAAENAADLKGGQQLLENGFALIYLNCSDFFDHAGKKQILLNVGRDAGNLLATTTITYLAGDGDPKNNKEGITNIGLATGLMDSGVDIYTRNFLFSSENIASVKELTLKALSTHQQAVRAGQPTKFQMIVQQLHDDQDICTPRYIATLVKSAIDKGEVKPAVSTNEANAAQDKAALDALGQALGLAGPVTMNQAFYYWWASFGPKLDRGDVQQEIGSGLKDISDDAKKPYDVAGKLRAAWTNAPHADVHNALVKFTPATLAKFASQADSTIAALDKNAAVDKANLAMVLIAPQNHVDVPKPNFAEPAAAPVSGHIGLVVE